MRILFSCYLAANLQTCKPAENSSSFLQDRVLDVENGIFVDRTEVSVKAFKNFVKQMKYKTTSDSLGWSGVFSLDEKKFIPVDGANWLKPEGIKNEKEQENNPVTQVSYYDACAFCSWKKGRLPTAAEWDHFAGSEVIKTNVWEGPFPYEDYGKDGYLAKPAPVESFEPNLLGIYHLFGNVWEWTDSAGANGQQIIKGGSFLCDVSFCSGYIPSKYQLTGKDSGLNHLGFRCVYDE